MSEVETGYRHEIELPQTLLSPIDLEIDPQHYRNEAAPLRRSEKGTTSIITRLDHITKHADDYAAALGVAENDDAGALRKMGEIANSSDSSRVKEFEIKDQKNKVYKVYESDTGDFVVLAIRKFKSNSRRRRYGEPENGEILTAFVTDKESIERRLKNSDESKQWLPAGQARVQ